MKTLGDRIRELRNARGWTKTELSRQACVGETSIKKVENEGGSLKIYTAYHIAKAFGLTLDELVEGVDLRQRADRVTITTEQEARVLRRREEDSLTYKEIGELFGVSKHTARALYLTAANRRDKNAGKFNTRSR